MNLNDEIDVVTGQSCYAIEFLEGLGIARSHLDGNRANYESDEEQHRDFDDDLNEYFASEKKDYEDELAANREDFDREIDFSLEEDDQADHLSSCLLEGGGNYREPENTIHLPVAISEDELSAHERAFDAESLGERFRKVYEKIMSMRAEKIPCCHLQCVLKVNIRELQKHICTMDVIDRCRVHRSVSPSNIVRQIFVRTVILTLRGNKQRLNAYRLPNVSVEMCRSLFQIAMGISDRTFGEWMRSGSCVPTVHGHFAAPSGRHREKMIREIVAFVQSLAVKEGMPWPKYGRDMKQEELLLPAVYSKRRVWALYTDMILRKAHSRYGGEIEKKEYIKMYGCAWSTFCLVTNEHLAHVRFSLRQRGLCNECWCYREVFRTAKPLYLVQVIFFIQLVHSYQTGTNRFTCASGKRWSFA